MVNVPAGYFHFDGVDPKLDMYLFFSSLESSKVIWPHCFLHHDYFAEQERKEAEKMNLKEKEEWKRESR
jgi:hypothetical protein